MCAPAFCLLTCTGDEHRDDPLVCKDGTLSVHVWEGKCVCVCVLFYLKVRGDSDVEM